MIKRKYIAGISAALCISLFACSSDKPGSEPVDATPAPTTEAPATEAPTTEATTEPPIKPVTINLVAIGDMLMHAGASMPGLQADGSYNYDYLFANVGDAIKTADLAVVNNEVIMGGNEIGLLGWPNFNVRTELADAEVRAGFDVVLSATNHTLDQHMSGLTNTLNYWNTNYPDIALLGVHESAEDAAEITIREVEGIKIAMLNYTYGTNGLPTPRGMVVNRIDTVQMAADIAAIDRTRTDVVCVVVHWGEEYARRPNRAQRAVAEFIHRQGAELIIGSHPHVVQPIECDSAARWATVYSLGNMVSNQQWRYSDGGLLVEVALSRVGDCAPSMSVRTIPVWVLCPDYRIVPQSIGDTLQMNAVARNRYTQFINDCQTLLK